MTYRENGVEECESEGDAAKTTVSVETTDAGSLGSGDQECYYAEAETPIDIHSCNDPPPFQSCGRDIVKGCPKGMKCSSENLNSCATEGFCEVDIGDD